MVVVHQRLEKVMLCIVARVDVSIQLVYYWCVGMFGLEQQLFYFDSKINYFDSKI